MNMNYERADGGETIELSRRPSIASIVLILVGILLVLQVALVLATRPLVLPLMILLVIAASSAGWLALIAMEAVLPVSVKLNKEGISIERLLGNATVPWGDLAAVKLIPSVGTLSDDPAASAKGRLAVGLFLKSRKTPRAHELEADIVVFGASDAHAELLLRLVERIADFKARVQSGAAEPGRRIRKAAAIAPPTAFRKNRPAA